MNIRTFSALQLTLVSLLALYANGCARLPVEVVETVPVETNLAVLGIRPTQEVWIDMVHSAKRSVDLEEFYITSKPGAALDPVLGEIKKAAARGVQIRFIVDSKFYKTYPNDPNLLASIPNIQVRQIDFSPGIQHAKFFIADGDQSFVGSANFDWLALSHIHEVGIRLKDSAIGDGLERIFAKDWDKAIALKTQGPHGEVPMEIAANTAPVRGFLLTASPPSALPAGIPDTLTNLLALIGSAKKSVKIQVYQYSATTFRGHRRWTVLDDALRKAISRGVHVQLLVDHIAMKSGGPDLKALNSLPGAEVRLVTIPEWSGGHLDYARLVHSKYMVVDDAQGWVGTENWQDSYFTNSRNVGLVINDGKTVSDLIKIFNRVWTSPYISQPK